MTLGVWQLQRHEERAARNELIEARMAAPVEPLSSVLAGIREAGDEVADEVQYRRTVAEGVFDADNELLLRSRTRDGQPGWHVLTPLVQESGRAVLVDRGWLPLAMDRPPIAQAPPPDGHVVVEGLVLVEQDPPEGWTANLAPRDPPEGRLRAAFYVDIERLAPQIPHSLEPVYLQLTAQDPPQPERLPLAPEPPELAAGPHLAYALQWFAFAAIGVVGYALLLRRTLASD